MMQTVIVILLVVGAAAYVALRGYRVFFPRFKAGKICGGSCCSHGDGTAPPPTAPAGPRTQMITSDSLRARIKVRRA